MLERLSAGEVTELLAFHDAEPFGEWRADLRAGVVASAVANWAGKTRAAGAAVARPVDYMPFERPAPETPEQLSARLLSYFKGL